MTEDSSQQRSGAGSGNVFGFIGALLGALVCFVGCAAEAAALGRPHKVSTAALAAVAIGCGVASAVLVRVAIRLEHGFRSSQPAARAAAPVAAPPSPHPKNGPVSRIVAILGGVGIVVFVVVLSISLHSRAARSSYTQHHGLARAGTVAVVTSVHHYAKTGSWTTYNYDVTLAMPADSVSHTVANDPTRDFQVYARGDPISVLVDPKQLGYAELPGSPVQSARWFWGPLLLGVIFAGLAVAIITEEIKHRRHKRAASA
jgi:hypothetical protein